MNNDMTNQDSISDDEGWITITVPRGSPFDPTSENFLDFESASASEDDADAVDAAAETTCTPTRTVKETFAWVRARHLVGGGRAKCFEAKCTVTWQYYKERGCAKKIIKRDCIERNVRYVPSNLPCP
ncbi:MAG TPA: hypothetical protein VF952_01840 [Chloroflexia bacterium]|jgi:hypothetical protein